MPGSPVQTLAGLEKHTIAINAPKDILDLLTALVLAEYGIPIKTVNFANHPFADMAPRLQSGAISAAVMPEPFASDAEQNERAVPLADLNQGATTAFPVEGYAVTQQWAANTAHAGGVLQGAGRGAADRRHQPRRGRSRDGERAGPVRRVQADRGGHGPGPLPGQYGTGRQRRQGSAAARST